MRQYRRRHAGSVALCESLESRTFLSATYYVSPDGNDNAAGTSAQTAWRTLDRANWAKLQAGDQLLFQGGATFTGTVYLDPNDKATVSAPIVIGSYGTGRATITNPNGAGFFHRNGAPVTIRDINFFGPGATSSPQAGVHFWNDLPNGAKVTNITVENVEVKGFHSGIRFEGQNGFAGFKDVRITGADVHDNYFWGISTNAPASADSATTFPHSNFTIRDTKVYNQLMGMGVYLKYIDNALVERSVAHNNGSLGSGAIGFMASHANRVTFQYNESYANKNLNGVDGGGFDFDSATTNSIMQYNYSHDNHGAGYLIAQASGHRASNNNIIRFNISQNDARNTGYGAIHVWSEGTNAVINNTYIYNNTVYIDGNVLSGRPSAFSMINWTGSGFLLVNNIFQSTDGVPLMDIWHLSGTDFVFESNAWWSTGATFSMQVNGYWIDSLSRFTALTGLEKLGVQADPQFENPGGGGTLNDAYSLTTLTAYKLKSTSPLLGRALNLSPYGISMGGRDYWGNTLTSSSLVNFGA